ncbi:hypothetical protein AHAS_Ahas20G0102900 [Arachis hypogaea]
MMTKNFKKKLSKGGFGSVYKGKLQNGPLVAIKMLDTSKSNGQYFIASIVTLTDQRGIIGYIAPELFYNKLEGISYKADVYSFGMLLMEMTNRMKNLNPHIENSSKVFFLTWIYNQFSNGRNIELDNSI